MLTALRKQFQEDSILERLEQDVRNVDPPDTATVNAFYAENPELFTRPASNHIAVILLGVDPSAGAPGWEKR